MTYEEREAAAIVGLQRVYRGLCEGVALMPDRHPYAKSFRPLIKDLAVALAVRAEKEAEEA